MNEKLTRSTITSGSKIIVPCYPSLSLFLAAAYLFASPADYEKSASYAYILHWLPIHKWGLFFLALGVFQTFAYFSHNRSVMVFSLCVGVFVYTGWAALFLVAVITIPAALPGAVGLYLFIAAAHLASAVSLSTDNVLPIGRR